MQTIPVSFAKLIEHFERLPGIGRKTAQRLAFHVLAMPREQAEDFAQVILDARVNITRCKFCQNLTESEVCTVCSDENRDKSVICVVAEPRDVISIEKTREYKGLYHVLHGIISHTENIAPEDICLRELVERVGDSEVKEIIMATSPTVEGEFTAMYVARLLKPIGIIVSRLAYGIPVGGDLEYADEITLMHAIQGRRAL